MGRPSLGPRLWFRSPRIHSTRGTAERGSWQIRDGDKIIATGCAEDQRAEAECALANYIANNKAPKPYFVYFISAKSPGFPIKIGISKGRQARFLTLQNALPWEIEVLALMPTQDPILERRLHRQFAHLRLKGEWFERAPELMDFINVACASGEAA